MIKLSYKTNKIDKNLVFFYNGEDLDLPKCDVLSFREARQKPKGRYTEKFTLVSNLHETEDDLLSKIDKRVILCSKWKSRCTFSASRVTLVVM